MIDWIKLIIRGLTWIVLVSLLGAAAIFLWPITLGILAFAGLAVLIGWAFDDFD